MASTNSTISAAASLDVAETTSEGLKVGFTYVRCNFFTGHPLKSSPNLGSIVVAIPALFFNPQSTAHAEMLKQFHDKLGAGFSEQLLAGQEWSCYAHEKPKKAADFRFHFFEAIHPVHYTELIEKPEEPKLNSAEIIPSLMAHSRRMLKNYDPKSVLEGTLAMLKDFGAYQPHLNSIALPVCSRENKVCMDYALRAINEFVKDLGRISLELWSLDRPYQTAENAAAMCQVCGRKDGLKKCAKGCGFWYCSKAHKKKDWSVHKSKCNTVHQATTNPLLRAAMQPIIPPQEVPKLPALVSIQYNFLVGNLQAGGTLTHFVRYHYIQEALLKDFTTYVVDEPNLGISEWVDKFNDLCVDYLMDLAETTCCLEDCDRVPSTEPKFWQVTMHPINPLDNSWKTLSIFIVTAAVQARLPYILLELNSLGAFGQKLKEEKEDMALVNTLMEKVGAKKGPIMIVAVMPICDSDSCGKAAYTAWDDFGQRVDCRMGVGCRRHFGRCPGSEGLEELRERMSRMRHL